MYSVLQLSQLIRNVWICGRIDSSSIIAHPIYTTGTIAKIRCQEVDISIIDRYNSFDNRYGFFVSNGNTSFKCPNPQCLTELTLTISINTSSKETYWTRSSKMQIFLPQHEVMHVNIISNGSIFSVCTQHSIQLMFELIYFNMSTLIQSGWM